MVYIPKTDFKKFVEFCSSTMDPHFVKLLIKCIDNVFITDLSNDLSALDNLVLRSLVLEFCESRFYSNPDDVPYCLSFGEDLEEKEIF